MKQAVPERRGEDAMATIGIRWENADPPADKDDWERVIAGAVADLSFTGTVVLRYQDGSWEVEAARVGQLPAAMPPTIPDPTDVQPQVEQALRDAGKPVRVRMATPAR